MLMLWLLIGLAACAGMGVIIYDFIEGKTLIHDLLDERLIARSNLEEADRAWAANPTRSDTVFSLTTIPSRLQHIDNTLKSLMRQSLAPAEIRLNIPKWSQREKTAYGVPERLRKLESVTIVNCVDYGPATKLIPSVLALDDDQRIVVVDDDRHYPKNLLAQFDRASRENPDAAFGFCGWVVPADLVHRPANAYTILFIQPPAPVLARRIRRQHAVDILRGVSGYLVKPRFFDSAALIDYSDAPEAAFFVDDVWISAHCRAPKFVLPARRSNYAPRRNRSFYHRTSLGWINNDGHEHVEQRNNTIVIRHFSDIWQVGGKKAAPSSGSRGI